MPSSPKTFLKRKRVWTHVKGDADLYQEGVHHSHAQPLDETHTGERLPETWPDSAPDQKGLERTDIPV